jgi:predicted Zn-dependent protease
LWNLWPHTFDSPTGRHASDGKLIWQTVWMKADAIRESLFARYALEAMDCYQRHQQAGAKHWVDEGLIHFPENVIMLNLRGILLLELGELAAARNCFMKLLSQEGCVLGMRGLMLNNIAYADAVLGGDDLLAEADQFSREAMSLIGWVPAVKGTRGATLLQMGRLGEALALLKESMEKAESASGKAQNACFIAIGEARQGNLTESRKYLDKAKQLSTDCFLLARAEKALLDAETHRASALTASA